MFQHHALFPHLDVGANVAFGLRMQGRRARPSDERVSELLDAGRARRGRSAATSRRSRAGSSSGSPWPARWRPRPRVLLLDEPLGSLDRPRRERLVVRAPRAVRPSRTSRSSRSPTTTPRRSRWPTGSSCSTAAASSRPVRRPRCGRHPRRSRVAELLGFTNLIDVTVDGGRAHERVGRPRPGRRVGPPGPRPARRRCASTATGPLEGTVVAGTFAGARGRAADRGAGGAGRWRRTSPPSDLPPVGAVVRVLVRSVRGRPAARLTDPWCSGWVGRAPYDASGSGSSSAPPVMPTTSSVLRRRRLVALARGPGHGPRRVRRAGPRPGRRRRRADDDHHDHHHRDRASRSRRSAETTTTTLPPDPDGSRRRRGAPRGGGPGGARHGAAARSGGRASTRAQAGRIVRQQLHVAEADAVELETTYEQVKDLVDPARGRARRARAVRHRPGRQRAGRGAPGRGGAPASSRHGLARRSSGASRTTSPS